MSPESLPTLHRLGVATVPDSSPKEVANEWLHKLSTSLTSQNLETVKQLFIDDACWKDVLALTWDYRSIQGCNEIHSLIHDRVATSGFLPKEVSLDPYYAPALRTPFSDLSWIQFGFDFETSSGKGLGYVRLVPTADGTWKCYTLCTSLEALNDPNPRPTRYPNHEHSWQEKRLRETAFLEKDPTVLIVGAGHSGLELAAHLGQLDVSTLVIDKNPRVGDNWRKRYKSLCLHDPVWYDQLPYMRFPSTWPIYSPKDKIADWIESYSNSLDLNVWTSTSIENLVWDESTKLWHATVLQENKTPRMLSIKHIIFANGLGGGVPHIPDIPGKDLFNGEILHSTAFHSAEDYKGKTALVVGSGVSAHDIAQDFVNHGNQVTMFQRSSTYVISAKAVALMSSGTYNENGPPIDVADRLTASLPNRIAKLIHQRATAGMAASVDKDILERLKAVGFKLNSGPEGAGAVQAFLRYGGRYYVDVGASSLIADGLIKLKAESEIESFTQHGLKFKDGTEIQTDVVVFATGFSDARLVVKEICSPKVYGTLKPVWGTDAEGELQSVWRDSGHPQLYFASGNFFTSRLFSHYLSLLIKAQELGVNIGKYLKSE